MPNWASAILAAAAVVTALGVLWGKVLKPGAKLISTTEEMLPLLRQLTTTFRDAPASFMVLRDIADQFKTNNGSSLKDSVLRLEQMAQENRTVLEEAARELRRTDEMLKVGVETAKQLAAMDRENARQLMLEVDRLGRKLDQMGAADADVAAGRRDVAEDLEARRDVLDTGTGIVAADLSAAQERAQVEKAAASGTPGAAADAAALPPTAAQRREQRRAAEAARRAQWEREDREIDDEDGAGEAGGNAAAEPTGDTPTTGGEGTGGTEP